MEALFGSLAFFLDACQSLVVMSEGVYVGRHTRSVDPRPPLSLEGDWRGRPSCRKQQRHSRGLPLEPVFSGTNLPSHLPTFLSPSIYSEPCLLAAGSSPGASGGGGWVEPLFPGALLSPPPDFQNTSVFLFFFFRSFVIQRRRFSAQSRRNLLRMIEFYFCSPASGMRE